MKKLFVFLLFTSVNVCTAQNSDSYFKTIPANLDDLPLWVKLMYTNDPNVNEVEFLYDQFYKHRPFEKNIHTQNYKHWKFNIESHVGSDGKIRPMSKEDYQKKIKAVQSQRTKSSENKTASAWKPIGPFNTYNESEQGNFSVSWQVNVYCFDQSETNPNILFAGTESGGIFKSVDKGNNWEYCSQDIPAVTVNDIKIAPSDSNIIFASANDNIYKSINQGLSWESVLSANAFQIEIHPTNPNICYVVGVAGLHKTIDGGQNWERIIIQQCWDIKLKPEDPNVVYLLQSNLSITHCEFLKSTDSGNTFTKIDNGWYNPAGIGQSYDQGARLAVTKANPSYIYVGLLGQDKDEDNGWIGVYKSEDSGESWVNPNLPDGAPYNDDTHQNLASINRDGTGFNQGFYNFAIEASDNDPEKVWVGCLALSESDDGGDSWTRIGSYNAQNDIGWIHPDIQDLHVLNDDIWVCTDGGINYSTDELQTHESRINGLYGSNYWGFGQGWNQDVIVGGRYHNGNSGYYETYGLGNTLRLGGAEAATGYVNPLKERKAYFSDISTKVIPEYIDGPTTALSPLSLYPNETYSLSYSSELVFDPRYSDHIIMGRDDKMWKSINEGGQFQVIYQFESGRILEIEQSRSNPDVLYCVYQLGSGGYWDDCAIFKSIDAGNTWERTSFVPSNDTWRMEITINPEDENELWVVALNAFTSQLIYNTTDGGETWQNKSSNKLENHYPTDIKFQAATDQLVYLSTDLGLFYWSRDEQEWNDCSEALPLVNRSMEIEPFYRDSKLRMITRGRGIYEADLVEKSRPIAQPMTTTDVIYCSRDTVQFDCYSILDHDGASWSWSFEPEPIYISDKNARNPKAVFGLEGSYDVTLEVTDGDGLSSSKTVSEMVRLDNRCDVDTFPGSVLLCQQNGDYVATPDLELFTNEMTISAWVKPDGIQGEYTGIVMNNGDAGGLNFRPDMELGYHWPGGAWWWSSGLYVPVDEWSYVAMVVKPDGVTIYLNGFGVTHAASIEEIDISSMLIGSYKAWDGRNFKGLIDEVCLWSRALSQDEIRELRHLTKDGISDPDFLAYYQFNEIGLPRVQDKIGDKHASITGNASIENSAKVPVASGTSQRKTITEAGVHNFLNAGVSIELSDNALVPDGEVVVSRLHAKPYPDISEDSGSNSYWIINNYGNELYGPVTNLNLEPFLNLTNSFQENPELGQLQNRSDNDDADNWEIKCNSIGIDDNYILFDENCIEYASGQYYVISADPNTQITSDVFKSEEGIELVVYPNPVVSNGSVYIDNPSNQKLRLKLFNADGKQVSDQIIYNDSFKIPSTFNEGIYFFQLETDNYIKSGKLIVH